MAAEDGEEAVAVAAWGAVDAAAASAEEEAADRTAVVATSAVDSAEDAAAAVADTEGAWEAVMVAAEVEEVSEVAGASDAEEAGEVVVVVGLEAARGWVVAEIDTVAVTTMPEIAVQRTKMPEVATTVAVEETTTITAPRRPGTEAGHQLVAAVMIKLV